MRKAVTPPAALRSLHGAERALLLSAHQSAVAQQRSAVAAAFASQLSAAEQRITAHVAGLIAAIDPKLSLSARMAEIGRLNDEQVAALLRLRQDIAAERRNALRATLGVLSSAYRRARNALAGRQQMERAGLRRIQQPRGLSGPIVTRPGWTAVRRLAVSVMPQQAKIRRNTSI